MVVCNRLFPCLHPRLQDGRPFHILHYWRCCHRRSVEFAGSQERLKHGQHGRAQFSLGVNMICQEQFWKHFFARAFALIVFPAIVYLSFFWIHFKILRFSGPGDSFMSPAFQETLYGNELLMNSEGMCDGDCKISTLTAI